MNLVQRKKEPPRDEQTVHKRHKQYSRRARRGMGEDARRSLVPVGLVGIPWHAARTRLCSGAALGSQSVNHLFRFHQAASV